MSRPTESSTLRDNLLETGQTEYRPVCDSEEAEGSPKYCQPCVDKGRKFEATSYCLHCGEYLCRRCSDIHCEPKPSRNHKLIGIDSLTLKEVDTRVDSKLSEDICTKHEHKSADFHCENHEAFCCGTCIILYHRLCDRVVCVEDAAVNIESNPGFVEMLKKVSEIQTRATDIKHEMVNKIRQIDIAQGREREKVDAFHKHLVSFLDKLKGDMDANIERIEQANLAKINNVRGRMNDILEEIGIFKKNVEDNLAGCRVNSLYRTLVRSKSVFRGFECKIDSLMCDPIAKVFTVDVANDVEKVLKGLQTLGDVRHVDYVHLNLSDHDCGNHDVTVEFDDCKRARLEDEINIRLPEDLERNSITGISVLSDNHLAVVDRKNPSIRIVDCVQKSVVSHMVLPGNPWDVVEVSSNKLAVSIPNMSSVRLIDRTAHGLSLGYRIDVVGCCHGIAVCDGKFIVSCIGDPDFILLLTITGEVLKTFILGEGKPLFRAPKYVRCVSGTDNFFVSNTNGNNVLRMNCDGDVLDVYDAKELKYPGGITVFADGRLFVKCNNKCVIYEINPADPRPRPLLIEHCCLYPQSPLGIAFNERSMVLYICSHRYGVIRVLKVETRNC